MGENNKKLYDVYDNDMNYLCTKEFSDSEARLESSLGEKILKWRK